jgi:type II secretory pathway component PulF
MPTYRYIALDRSGHKVAGSLAGQSRSSAIATLAQDGVFVTELKEAPAQGRAHPSAAGRLGAPNASTGVWGHLGMFRRLPARRKAAIFRQLATALKAGLPLLPALQVVQEQLEHAGIRALVADLAGRVHSGESLSQAMEAHPRQFSRLEISMARVGETAGLLDQVMGYLSSFAEHEVDVREKIRTAAAYPLFVLVLALISVVVIVSFILPRILGVVTENAATLPWPTQLLIRASDFLGSYGWMLGAALVAAGWGFHRWLRRPQGRLAFDRFKLRVPVLGLTLRKLAVARFARTLGTLSKSGIQILEALNVLRDTLGNEELARHVSNVAAGISQGQSIAEPLRQTGQFPPLLIQVIAMGERTGKLDELLLQTAEAYEKETSAAIQRTMTILPAVFIVLLALVVLFVLSAVLLPIVNMETSVPGM